MKPLNVISFLFAALLSALGAAHVFAQSVNLSEIDTSVRMHVDTSLIVDVPEGIQEVTMVLSQILAIIRLIVFVGHIYPARAANCLNGH